MSKIWKPYILAAPFVMSLFILTPARAVLVINNPLQGSTNGTREGGTFVPGGWRVDDQYNCIYWHTPTTNHGYYEFDIIGIPSCGPGLGKNELSHLYDYTFGNGDVNYTGGYRDTPYKHFLRRECVSPKTDTMEILWVVSPCVHEDDTPPLTWSPTTSYRFRMEWENTGGNSTSKVYRNGTLIMQQTGAGSWSPAGQSFRIASSTRRADEGAIVGAIYSNVKIEDLLLPSTEVTIDLGSPDVSSGLTNPQVGDGDTTPATIGGRTGRRNLNPAEDFYFYFAVNDAYAYQANNQDQYIIIDYYDTGTSTLTLEYDSNTGNTLPAFYKNGGSVTLTNTNTWKSKLFHVTDAYFGNRQNGGADFRIGNVGNTFYLDFIRVTTEAPIPPIIAEVAPDPQLAYFGVPYTQQLVLIQGDPAPSWTMLDGPPGATVNSSGLVSGWTPSAFGNVSFSVQATNLAGSDTEDWGVRLVSRSDFDLDDDADLADFAHLQLCFSGDGHPQGAGCSNADLDGDNDVDAFDFNVFLPCMQGANNVPGC